MKNKKNEKRSINAQAVAKDIITTIRKGLKVNKGEILKKHGYTESMSKKPNKVLNTDSAREVLDPFVEAMIEERDAALKRMKKVRGKAKYRDLTDGLDKLTKNIQLLSGKETDRHGLNIGAIIDSLE